MSAARPPASSFRPGHARDLSLRSPSTWLFGAALGAWSVATVASTAGVSAWLGGHKGEALRYGVPLILCGLVALRHRTSDPRLRFAAAVSLALSLALYAAPRAATSTTIALGLPGVMLTGVLVARRPSAALLLLFAITGTFGSLEAFTSVPTGVISTLLLGGLWTGVVWRYAFDGERAALQPSPAMALVWAYVALTLADILADEQIGGALQAFRTSGFYMTIVLLIALAGWQPAVRERIAKGILAITLLVSAYAVLRIAIGPAAAERSLASASPFDFVNGHLKPAGSLANGASLGVWTSVMLPYCAAMALAMRGHWRAIAAAGVVLCGIALIATQLRTAVVAVTVGLLLVVALVPRARAFPGLRLGPALSAIALAAATALVAVAFAAGPDPATHSYSAIFHPGSDPSVTARTYKWGRAFKEIDRQPLGQGIGSATSGFSGDKLAAARSVGIGSQSIDSGYLKIALEQGFPVLAVYVAALLALIMSTGRRAQSAPEPFGSAISLAACGSLASFSVLLLTGAFAEGLPGLAAWIIAGLGLAELASRQLERATPPVDEPALAPVGLTSSA